MQIRDLIFFSIDGQRGGISLGTAYYHGRRIIKDGNLICGTSLSFVYEQQSC